MSASRSRSRLPQLLCIVVSALVMAALLPLAAIRAVAAATPDHLVISEVATGGPSASDELIEIYNPTAAPQPLQGLELIYASASGLTVSRRAEWDAGTPPLDPGRHLLIANELGAYASMADAVYGSGMAAAGGSVALRIQDAASAIDAVGWGTAASSWLEGSPAPAPAPGSSLERLPGGALGSTQDTDQNATDFVERAAPDPQNTASPPVPLPGASPTPTPTPTLAPTSTPLPTPDPATPILAARALADGSVVTIEGTALSGSDFHDGGGYVADASGGIAVLLADGTFARGARLRITGTVDDRFAQRTVRADGSAVTVIGTGVEPEAVAASTGSIGEALEAALVRISGRITGAPSELSGGLAYELDDGTGPVRVIVGSSTGIDTGAWVRDAAVELVGIVGQRDSSGSGSSGYRVQPRDPGDVVAATAPSASASASPSPSADPSASPTPPASDGAVIAIADARSLPKGAEARIRGVVTLPSGVVDPATAAVQDASGAIVLRLGDGVGALALGERIEAAGVRSTLAGMETIRIDEPPTRLGPAAQPAPHALRTGDAGEADEARLVLVRGELVASARTASSGTVSFEIDDGSGPLRVVVAAALAADDTAWTAGTSLEVIGVLGQETTGSEPLAGYRVWPSTVSSIAILAPPSDDGGGDAGGDTGGGGATAGGSGDLGDVESPEVRVGATLVAGPWEELGIGGLLWDGAHLVAVSAAAGARLASLTPPVPIEVSSLTRAGTEPITGLTVVAIPDAADAIVASAGVPVQPATSLPGPGDGARWVTIVGQLVGGPPWTRLQMGPDRLEIDLRCSDVELDRGGAVSVTGIGLGEPRRIVVPCDGIRSAPTLVPARGLAFPGSSAGATASPAPAPMAAPEEAATDRRPLAIGLLGLGVLVLAGGALARRRLGTDDDDDPAALEADEEEPAPASAPQLTLVALPHERGPR